MVSSQSKIMQVWLILGLSYWRSQILSYVSLESSLSLICWLLLDFARKFELSMICVSVAIRRSPSVLSSYELLRKGFDSLLFCSSLAVEGVNGSSPFSNRIVTGLFTSELSLLKWTDMRERTRVLLCSAAVLFLWSVNKPLFLKDSRGWRGWGWIK